MNEIAKEIIPNLTIPKVEKSQGKSSSSQQNSQASVGIKRITSFNFIEPFQTGPVHQIVHPSQDSTHSKKLKGFNITQQHSQFSESQSQAIHKPSQSQLNSQGSNVNVVDPVDDNVTNYPGNNQGLMFIPKISDKKNGKFTIKF
jgi:hypothetical protein